MAFEEFTGKFDPLPKYEEFKGEFEPLNKNKKEEAPSENGNFFRGLKNTIPSLYGTAGAAEALAGLGLSKLGAKETGAGLTKAGLEKMDYAEKNVSTKETDEFTNAWHKGIGTVLTDWLPYQVGSGVGNIAESLAFAGAGAGLGALTGAGVGAAPGAVAGFVEKTLIKNGIKEEAEKLVKEGSKEEAEKLIKQGAKDALKSMGSTAGMVAQAGMHGMGETTQQAWQAEQQRAQQEGRAANVDNLDLTKLLPAAAVHGVADFINEKIGLGAIKGGDKASKYLVGDILKNIGMTGLKESGGELIQSAAERYGANLSMTDADAINDYINTVAASFGMAFGPGGVGGVKTHINNKAIEEIIKEKANSENSDLKRQSTSQEEVTKENLPAKNPELDALLNPSQHADGNALATAAPATVIAQTEDQNPTTQSVVGDPTIATAAPGVKENKLQPKELEMTAQEIEDYIENNKDVKGAKRKNTLKKIERLQTRLEELKNVEQPNGQPGGTSTEVVQSADQRQPAAGAAGPDANGMVSSRQDARVPNAGAITKPPSIIEQNEAEHTDADLNEAVVAKRQAQNPGKPNYWRSNPNDKTNTNSWQDTSGNIIYGHEHVLPTGSVVTNVVNGQGGISLQIKDPETNEVTGLPIDFDKKGVPHWRIPYDESKGEYMPEEKFKQAIGEDLYNAIGNSPVSSDNDQQKLIARINSILGKKQEAEESAALATEQVGALEETKPYSEWNHPTQGQQQAPNYIKPTLPEGNAVIVKGQAEDKDIATAIKLADRNDAKIEEDRKANLGKSVDEERRKIFEGNVPVFLKKDAKGNIVEDKTKAKQMAEEYNETRKELAKKDIKIPVWKSLTKGEKEFYLDHIINNTIEEHDAAGRALAGFRERNPISEAEAEKENGLSIEEQKAHQRIRVGYEQGRMIASKMFGVEFPQFSDLTPEQQNIYLRESITNAGLQTDIGFEKLGENLVKNSYRLSQKQKLQKLKTIEKLKDLNWRDEYDRIQNKEKSEPIHQTPSLNWGDKKSTMTDEQEAEVDKMIEEIEKRKSLPSAVLKQIQANNLQGVLQHLRTQAKLPFLKTVAQRIFEMKLPTQIQLVDSLPNNDLAIYDPKTDTIFVTKEGLSDITMLHEVVHAATINVLRKFLTNPKGLTREQFEAAEHLQEIMNLAKEELEVVHPEAFKNLYEFVSYALTDPFFQKALSELDTHELATTIVPEAQSMWTEFTLGMAKALNILKDLFSAKKGTKEKFYISENTFLPEIFTAFEAILSPPTGGIEMAPLPTTKKAPKAEKGRKNDDYKLTSDQKPTSISRVWKVVSTREGFTQMATAFQNRAQRIKNWEKINALSGVIVRVGRDKINNIFEQITTAAADARNYYTVYLQEPTQRLETAVAAYAKSAKLSTEQALEQLHKYLEAIHEPERRMVKFILGIPLSKAATLVHNGNKISPADRRDAIVRLLKQHNLSEAQAKQLREELDNIIFQKDSKGQIIYDKKGNPKLTKYIDPLGYSPYGKISLELTSSDYNATGLLSKKDENFLSSEQLLEEYNTDKNKAEIEAVRQALQDVHKATADLNKIGNYWSQPVSNFVNFYGFENYVPLKGNPNHTELDDMIDLDSRAMGRELQDSLGAMDGRFSTSKNPVLQTLSDATRSAMRAGRRNLTQSIKNSLEKNKLNPNGQGMLAGRVKQTIKFEDRDKVDMSTLKGEKTIFHYNQDGSIDILVIDNPDMANSIRNSYRKVNPLLNLANSFTGFFGQLHTRYNYSFAPMNFVRDALTNAFTIGAEMGPAEAARFIKAISTQVVAQQGLNKAMKVAILYKKGDDKSLQTLQDLADKEPYIRDMLDLIRKGGMVTYMHGQGLRSGFEDIHKELGRNGIVKTKEQLDKVLDTWTDMFELASRTAAYGIAKENQYKKNIAKGMSEKEAREDASVKGITYAKNLANFEQVGNLGKVMGAFFMFFRPSATGAVRAIEAIAPAFTKLTEGSFGIGEPLIRYDKNGNVIGSLPAHIRNNPAALEEFKKNYAAQQTNARIMSGALLSLGMLVYTMSFMSADDDELGRNATATDNMQQWTRYARFHIPRSVTQYMGLKDPVTFQMPWGFGLGAFASAGAQFAAIISGHQSIKDGFANVFGSIALDSFVPLPISKMSPVEDPLAWLVDSITPSVARPIIEFLINKNSLGQHIYSDQNRRMGDAYTGGDSVPQIYKDAAKYMVTKGILGIGTLGDIDVSPNTLYFLSNNYFDGIGRIAENVYGFPDIAKSRDNFNLHRDLILFNSFFGTRSNVDSREFTNVENKIKDMEKQIKQFDQFNPEAAARYDAKNPFNRMLVDMYNEQVNRSLRDLRTEANEIRGSDLYNPGAKKDLLKINILMQNIEKRNMIEQFKAYGVKP